MPETPKVKSKPAGGTGRPTGQWEVYPYFLLLILRPDFLFWTVADGLAIAVVVWASVTDLPPFLPLPAWLGAAAIAIAIVVFILRWARFFLVRMIVDYDARNGDGLISIERLIPVPGLPESVQISLQDAADGNPEVNTAGLFNTLITLFKPLSFLRFISYGDLTLRGRGSPFSITMYGIRDPSAVMERIQKDWRALAALKAKQKAAAERQEEIDRITVGVAEGLKKAQQDMKVMLVRPAQDGAVLAPQLPPTREPLSQPPVSTKPDPVNEDHRSPPAQQEQPPAPLAAEPDLPEVAPLPDPPQPPPANTS